MANLVLLLVSTAASLLVAEGLVRLVRPQALPSQEFTRRFVLPGMYLPDEKAGYRLAPNFAGRLEIGERVTTFSTNSLGLRGAELGARARVRVAAFGDSVTWGWSVEQGEEWVSMAGREMTARLGQDRVEFLNCGVAGYGTENALGLLESLGSEIRPDLVLLGFFPNDFVDNIYGRTAYSVRDGCLFDELTHRYLQEGRLAGRSHLWRLLLQAKRGAETHGESEEAGRLQSYFLARRFTETQLAASAARTADLIIRMREAARALDARFAVVWLPMDWQVLDIDADMELDTELRRRVEAAGIASLNLLPVFRSQEARRELFFGAGDTHFTVRGHRLAGAAVARWLLESALLADAHSGPGPS